MEKNIFGKNKLISLWIVFLSLTGCGQIHRHIEAVAVLSISVDTGMARWGDTITLRYKIKNKTSDKIQICRYPGPQLDMWWNYYTSKKSDTQISWLRVLRSGGIMNGGLDTSYYVTLGPGAEFIDTAPLYLWCGLIRGKKQKQGDVTTSVTTGHSCEDTADHRIDAEYISISTGYDDGYNAAVGELRSEDLHITVLPGKIKTPVIDENENSHN